MNKSNVMINKHVERALFSLRNEALERIEEYTYFGQVVRADPNHERELRCRTGMSWSALGKQCQIMKSKLPLSLERRVRAVGDDIWSRNLAAY